MHVYRALGDAAGTTHARELAIQLIDWHDTMVNHLRVLRTRGGRCEDECPHVQARSLWQRASATFGDSAEKLGFLQRHAHRAP
jgi:hypothetical protein